MATFVLPSRNMQQGTFILGPFVALTPWNRVAVSLEAAQLSAPVTLLVQQSPDGGTNWVTVQEANHLDDDNGIIAFSLQRGDLLYPAGPVRLNITNAAPWQTDGGTITVEQAA